MSQIRGARRFFIRSTGRSSTPCCPIARSCSIRIGPCSSLLHPSSNERPAALSRQACLPRAARCRASGGRSGHAEHALRRRGRLDVAEAGLPAPALEVTRSRGGRCQCVHRGEEVGHGGTRVDTARTGGLGNRRAAQRAMGTLAEQQRHHGGIDFGYLLFSLFSTGCDAHCSMFANSRPTCGARVSGGAPYSITLRDASRCRFRRERRQTCRDQVGRAPALL